ncbi:hypothetical protein [Geothrix sp. 21YS21S-4]|uniref:hypothetical protein n=1 Tax=Geothrix sp. 21YS21S-4 TaxID=3068889 RepID=UPI0027B9BBD7|nr:hypothetical protein [Geothrix sp. 21YS21S-4]
MSVFARPALRWSALAALWAVMGAVLWLTAVQAFLIALNPFCRLQRPGVTHAAVQSVDRDPDSQITDFVTVKRRETEEVLRMAKAEAAALQADDEVWILDAWYADGLRPTQFRLTPQRILLEYPGLLLLPIAWGLWRLRKARQEAEAAPLPPVRRVFVDDLHLRAQRFAKPGEKAAPPPAPEGGE